MHFLGNVLGKHKKHLAEPHALCCEVSQVLKNCCAYSTQYNVLQVLTAPFFMTGRTIETFSALRTNFVEFLWYLWIFWEDFKFFWLMHTYFNKQLSLNCSINPLFKLKHIESHQVIKIFSKNMKFIKMTSFQLYIDCQIIKLTFII